MGRKRTQRLLGALVLAFLLLAGVLAVDLEVTAAPGVSGSPKQAAPAWAERAEYEEARVVRVVDGDTLVVRRAGGKDERLRLIGMDTPESVAGDESRNCEEGRIASAFTQSVVPEGARVWLQKDVSETDRFGRLLRYVWLGVPEDARDPQEVASKMLNGLLVAEGYAKAKRYPPDTSYAETFRCLGEQAIGQNKGISYFWS